MKFEFIVKLMSKKYGVGNKKLPALFLPPVGTEFALIGMRYKVVYVCQNPLRFSAEPVGVYLGKKIELYEKILGWIHRLKIRNNPVGNTNAKPERSANQA